MPLTLSFDSQGPRLWTHAFLYYYSSPKLILKINQILIWCYLIIFGSIRLTANTITLNLLNLFMTVESVYPIPLKGLSFIPLIIILLPKINLVLVRGLFRFVERYSYFH